MRFLSHQTNRLALGVFGLFLVATLVHAATLGRADATAKLDDQLSRVAEVQAAEIAEYFERSSALLLVAANNPAFESFYASDTSLSQRIDNGGPTTVQLNDALTFLESLYPGRLSEACFIDGSGAEIARVVDGRIALPSELSRDEKTNAFFSPTTKLNQGQVLQASPYVSPDTNDWVISNSNPIDVGQSVPAVVHFEVTLESFRQRLEAADFDTSIVDSVTATVVAQHDLEINNTSPLGEGVARFEELRSVDRPTSLTINRRRYRAEPVQGSATNQNKWMVVVSSHDTLGWFFGFGLAHALSLIAGASVVLWGRSSLRRQQDRLAAAMTDELTGLASREQLNQELASVAEESDGRPMGLMILDLDRFKEVNDTLGHSEGDLLLKGVAQRIAGVVDGHGALARLGGDEFAILTTTSTLGAIVELAEQVREAIGQPFALHQCTVNVSASVGIALVGSHGAAPAELLRHADVAMYEAKRSGRGVVIYDDSFDVHSPARLDQINELKEAIEQGRIQVYYQPKIDTETGEASGAEALARWTQHDGTVVPPDVFIDLAAQTGQLIPLTTLVIERAVGQIAEWNDMGLDVGIAINVSAHSLLDPSFVDEVASALRRHRVSPRQLTIELTESAVMSDTSRSARMLSELRRIGVQISIDDFGTGYSSLEYLRKFPVSELKIDRSFVTSLDSNAVDMSIVRASIELGHGLGLQVVAEGVETDEALTHLKSMGCDIAQGYFFSRPLPSSEATQWLLSHPSHRQRIADGVPSDLSELEASTETSSSAAE